MKDRPSLGLRQYGTASTETTTTTTTQNSMPQVTFLIRSTPSRCKTANVDISLLASFKIHSSFLKWLKSPEATQNVLQSVTVLWLAWFRNFLKQKQQSKHFSFKYSRIPGGQSFILRLPPLRPSDLPITAGWRQREYRWNDTDRGNPNYWYLAHHRSHLD